MGYSCPVCETPQHDSEHLANHLAMTAMLHEDDHEAWLDRHVDGWGELTPPELGKRVVDAAEQVDYDDAAAEAADIPDEFRDAGDGEALDATDVPDSANVPPAEGRSPARGAGTDSLDEDIKEVLEEARDLTEQRRERAAEVPEEPDSDDDEAAEREG